MRALILLSLLGLCACSSSVPDMRYYLLQPDAATASREKLELSDQSVRVSVELADYLQRSNLAMLIHQHELYYAPSDVWSEPLAPSIEQTLVSDLNQIAPSYLASNDPLSSQAGKTLLVNVRYFVSTDRGTVILSGDFNFYEIDQKTTKYPFYFEEKLTKNGYAEAVNQLRQLVAKLAAKIQRDTT